MLPRPGVTQTLARFVVETKWEDIPEQARHEAKRALLEFLRRGDRRLPHRAGRARPQDACRILRRQTGDDRRPDRAHRRLERRLPERGRRQRLRLLRHPPFDRHPSDGAARAGAAVAGRAPARDRAGTAAGLRAWLRDRMPGRRRRLARPLPQGLAHHLDLRRLRFGGGRGEAAGGLARRTEVVWSAGQRGHAVGRACANVWAGRPRASASATPRAMACCRRCWRTKASLGRPNRSPAPRASWPRWASRRTGQR